MKEESSEKEEETGDLLQKLSHPKLARFPKPDLSQVIKFTPEMGKLPPSPFGTVPDIVAQLISNLPPANAFQGPRYNIDEVMRRLQEAQLPPPPPEYSPDPQEGPKKRKAEEDEEDEGMKAKPLTVEMHQQTAVPLSKDVFRQRQAAKMSKKST